MADRNQIVAVLDQLLDAKNFRDYAPIGLQVEGVAEVQRVVTGVSFNLALLEQAEACGAQMLIVHHGMFWKGESPVLRGPKKQRIRRLLESDITLLGYHLPLDAHAELGNNARLVDTLGAQRLGGFGEYHGAEIGALAEFAQPITLGELQSRFASITTRPMVFGDARRTVTRFGVVSGGAGSMFEQAIEQGLDLFVTGEPWEPAQALAAETGVAFAALGHHDSEKLGVIAVGDWLQREVGVEVRFIDVPNPA